jgi:nucleoside-diphosphate-sugar epimerase
MPQPLKIVITGATGFVGRHLLEDIDPSKYTVRVITRNKEKKIIVPAGSEIMEADLNNVNSLKKAFEGMDVVVNMAAEVRDEKKLEETNVGGTQNLIHAALSTNVSRIIHLSSVGVVGMQYSNVPIIISEDSACFPKNEYERTKLASEKLLIEAHKQNKFRLTILRPTNVFGEHHPFNALLHLINHINSGKTTACTRSATVNYVYVKDLTSLILQLVSDEREYGIVNVGSSCNLHSMMNMLSEELHKKKNIISAPQFLVNFIELTGIKKLRALSNRVVYSDEKLKTFYKYPYGIEKGLKRVISFYNEQDLIK